jgi:hypothetical protein
VHVVKPYMDDVNDYTFNLGITRFEEPAAASARGTYARPLTIGFSRSTNSYTHFISPAACIIHVVRDGLFTSSVSPTQIRSSGLGLRLNDCSTNSGVVSSAGFYPRIWASIRVYILRLFSIAPMVCRTYRRGRPIATTPATILELHVRYIKFYRV